MKVCALIRENQLTVYDPRGNARMPSQLDLGSDIATKYAAALDKNPVRVAMRRRQAERAEADRLRRERAPREVGQQHDVR